MKVLEQKSGIKGMQLLWRTVRGKEDSRLSLTYRKRPWEVTEVGEAPVTQKLKTLSEDEDAALKTINPVVGTEIIQE